MAAFPMALLDDWSFPVGAEICQSIDSAYLCILSLGAEISQLVDTYLCVNGICGF